MFFRSLVNSQYCEERLWQKGSVLCLRPEELEFPVSGGQRHPIHLTILRRFSKASLAYVYTQKWPEVQLIH